VLPTGGDTNRDKRGIFVPVGGSTRDKSPLSLPLAQLAVGLGTKTTFCPGPKGSQDKWPGTKTCSVVMIVTPVILDREVGGTKQQDLKVFCLQKYFFVFVLDLASPNRLPWINWSLACFMNS